WEMTQVETVAPHDSVGSNLNLHLRGNRVMRVHPRDNESINESWISDRDRFSYAGLYSEDRLRRPMLKKGDTWQETDWETALELAAKGLKDGGNAEQIGTLCSPSSTLEELYLAQKLTRGLGSENIDSRLRQGDFRLDIGGPALPWLGLKIEAIEELNAALLIGSNLRKEQPILGHRLRKAALAGAAISFLNPLEQDINYQARQQVVSPAQMLQALAAVAKALGVTASGELGTLIKQAKASDFGDAVAKDLQAADAGAVVLGDLAVSHPDYALLSSLARKIADQAGCSLGFTSQGANAMGCCLAGAVPHLGAGAKPLANGGLHSQAMLNQPLKAYLLLGVEPGRDLWDPALAQSALQSADTVVALTAYRSESLEACADILLPIAGFAETSGTYVNGEGVWQHFRGAVNPFGESRPSWKVMRVLGNLLDLDGFDYTSSDQVLDEVSVQCKGVEADNNFEPLKDASINCRAGGLMRIGNVPMYAQDALVRRAAALQQTKSAGPTMIRINSSEVKHQGVEGAELALVKQNGNQVSLPLEIDDAVPDGCVWIPTALAETEMLGQPFGEVTLEKA
ncbi:MAG: molybdopterin-dependent oxidoreductase, partial [Gammaproteobacteria bacterium]|nr:molybdopterin-dependent oxidoreductase [Gammaproteobacteria bacterium]